LICIANITIVLVLWLCKVRKVFPLEEEVDNEKHLASSSRGLEEGE